MLGGRPSGEWTKSAKQRSESRGESKAAAADNLAAAEKEAAASIHQEGERKAEEEAGVLK